MKIRIREADPERDIWFNARIGEVFEVTGEFSGVPRQWQVFDPHDATTAHGVCYVPVYFADVVEEPK